MMATKVCSEYRRISTFPALRLTRLSLVLLGVLFILSLSRGNIHSKKLYENLMKRPQYNRLVRPVNSSETKIDVRIGLKLTQLIDLDEQNQFMTTNVWVILEWMDPMLTWDPDEYGAVQEIYMPADSIWNPDIVLYNNADGNYQMTMKTKPRVSWDGSVKWHPPASLKSSCTIDVRHFPFDEQHCELRFGSWTYNIHEVDIMHINDTETEQHEVLDVGIDYKNFYRSVEWDVMAVPARKNIRRYAGSEEPFPEWIFSVTIRRKFMFYTINLIIPLVSHAFLTILVFYLPSDSREKISLCINILLSLTVYFLMLAEIIPPTSLVVPLLAEYLLFTMALVTLSVIITAITLNVHFRTSATHTMPDWVRKVFLYTLPRVLMMRRPKVENSHDLELKHIKLRLCTCFTTTEPRERCAGGPRYQFGSKRTKTQIELMRLSKALDEQSPWGAPQSHFCPEVRSAIDGAIYIANHLKQEDVAKRTREDWKYVALVIDRVFLIIYAVVTTACTVWIICKAPSVFDTRIPLVA